MIIEQDYNQVVLCNDNGEALGSTSKARAHRLGLKHLAISVFLFNEDGQILLQQRSNTKYHAPGALSNSVCSHPLWGELPQHAAFRRIKEELGIDVNQLDFQMIFRYQCTVPPDAIEHEVDYIYFAKLKPHQDIHNINYNPKEVSDIIFFNINKLNIELSKNVKRFSPWFILLWENNVLKRKLRQWLLSNCP